MGVPVVCSNIGFAGLGIKSGEGAIMQTDPKLFAGSVVEILSSEEQRRRIGQEGVNVIKTRFDWNIISLTLERYFKDIAPNS